MKKKYSEEEVVAIIRDYLSDEAGAKEKGSYIKNVKEWFEKWKCK